MGQRRRGRGPSFGSVKQSNLPAPGYADVHPELVAIDALDPDRPWPHEVVRDEGADVVIELYRTEGYERAAARAVATEAVKPEWPAWRVVRS